jgi:dTDP-4-dehydrorhamnose 3,5-epimerase
LLFRETGLKGAFLIEPERLEDERGFFARTWCPEELESQGLDSKISQCSISFNSRKGTLRGMHFQREPHAEVRIVRCTAGRIYDVMIDLRRESATFCRWHAAELSSENRSMLYVPKGFAHGFQTLQDDAEVLYMMSEPYHQASAAGVRWDDPAFAIEWPLEVTVISQRDREYPDFKG